jgi:hypothetical protein
MFAAVTHTPLPVIYRMTFRQFASYYASMPKVMAAINPLAGLAKKDERISDPSKIYAVARAYGIPVKNAPDR